MIGRDIQAFIISTGTQRERDYANDNLTSWRGQTETQLASIWEVRGLPLQGACDPLNLEQDEMDYGLTRCLFTVIYITIMTFV